MGNAAEIVREVGVDDVCVAKVQAILHLHSRLLGIAARPIGVLFGGKVGFEDRFEHQHRCCHAHPIPQGRDTQGPKFAVGFRDEHSPDRVRSVSLLSERKRQFRQPSLHPIRFDVGEVLPIHARRAFVGAALGVGMGENVFAVDLVVQGVEAIAGF